LPAQQDVAIMKGEKTGEKQMRLIEIVADAGHTDTLGGLAEQHGATDVWWGSTAEDGRRTCRMLVPDDARQAVMDGLQTVLSGSENTRIVVLPVDAALPRPQLDPESERRRSVVTTREELYSQIEKGAHIDSNFLLLVVLSTFVAAIGLAEDNVAVVIGAMVIAPLLGPNIALAFATSLGDTAMAWTAAKTILVGLGLAFAVSMLLGLLWPVNLASHEILSRTDVGLGGVALALASGAAAVLSLTTGLSSTLVGVMVAVALLPPTATLGMLLGSGQVQLATGAALLLAVNVVCVILAAKVVFLAKGVKPRTWLEKRKARQSWAFYATLWASLLLVLLVVIVLREQVAL
jgi:uncharacterized hydrophobic protein (TIGR00341 family)